MKKLSIILFALITILILSGCAIRTPQINGLVLDEETKQPVPDAWIWARIELNTTTIAGNVHSAIEIDEPHTRTDKDGKFIVPSRKLKGSTFPLEFGTEVVSLAIGASTVDNIGSRLNYYGGYKEKHYGKGDGDLNKLLWKSTVDITMYAKQYQNTESETFNHLQSLYNYCTTGRSGIEVPAVEGGCDDWELNYAIKKYERFLEKYNNPKLIENPPYGVSKWDKIHKYSRVIKDLSSLYTKRGDYKKALIILNEARAFDEKHGSVYPFITYEHEKKRKELEKLINENSTK